jgi:hypothetical protein
MDQKVEYIDIEKLVLWTENPRDPIDENATDQDVVERALNDDKYSKWSLAKLAKEMGDYYDLSELPTVVYYDTKPVVYDGNRRMILAKIKHGCVDAAGGEELTLPEFPRKIPCNVCTKEIAIKNVFRKHGDSGSWSPLDRDYFLHKFMKQPKSPFLKIEESTGLISSNPHLNKGFVKKEILNLQHLSEMGFDFEEDKLISRHSNKEAKSILEDISNQVVFENISTRKNRGQILSLLHRSNREVIDKNKNNAAQLNTLHFNSAAVPKVQQQTRRVKKKETDIFGKKLFLKPGDVSNLYRDIVDLYNFYQQNKSVLSSSFTSLIRMSLRLLCEAAANDSPHEGMDKYIKAYFAAAKKALDQDEKTTLSSENVNEGTIVQQLHTGAHNYSAANNLNKTLAISLILGEILNLSHGKK